MISELIIASNNAKKTKEIQALLEPLGIEVFSQKQFDLPSIEETGKTFIENAILKARYVAEQTGKPALADDSGLCLPALQGAPGIYSARFAGEDGNDSKNNQKLIDTLKAQQLDKPAAYYYCALALFRYPDDPEPLIATGKLHGHIQAEAQGADGFGYDPHFYLSDYDKTAAEIKPELKNSISHRAVALKQLLAQLLHTQQ